MASVAAHVFPLVISATDEDVSNEEKLLRNTSERLVTSDGRADDAAERSDSNALMRL